MIHLAIVLLVAGAASLAFALGTAVTARYYQSQIVNRRIWDSRR